MSSRACVNIYQLNALQALPGMTVTQLALLQV